MQYSNTTVQVPYTPTATMYEYVSWQANDPLVHYLAGDLNFQGTESVDNNGQSPGPTTGRITLNSQSAPVPKPNFNQKNDRYQPWGMILANLRPRKWM